MTITKKEILRVVKTFPQKVDVDMFVERLYLEQKKKINWAHDSITKAVGSFRSKYSNTSKRVDRILYSKKGK